MGGSCQLAPNPSGPDSGAADLEEVQRGEGRGAAGGTMRRLSTGRCVVVWGLPFLLYSNKNITDCLDCFYHTERCKDTA